MKTISILIIILFSLGFAQVDTVGTVEKAIGIPAPAVVAVDTNQVIIVYYSDQNVGKDNILAYSFGYAVHTKYSQLDSWRVPETISYYAADGRFITQGAIFSVKSRK